MKQTINIGADPDDGTGDVLRTAFDKVNDNFNELYSLDGGSTKVRTITGVNVTTSTPTAAQITADIGLTPAQAGAGYICNIIYSAVSNNEIQVTSDGTFWKRSGVYTKVT